MDLITIESPAYLSILVEGYQFNFLQSVFLSAGNASIFPSTTAIDQFTNSRRVSAICPEFVGYQVPTSAYAIIDNNRLILSSEFIQEFNGILDVIFLNRAGYTKLSDSGYLIQTGRVFSENSITTLDGSFLVSLTSPGIDIVTI